MTAQKSKVIAEVKATTPPKNNVTPTTTADTLIAQAIEKGMSIETIEKFLAMRKELKAEYAKEQFDIAMSIFQSKCPVIEKSKAGGKIKETGKVAYYYAPLDLIIHSVQSLLEETGLSYTFDASKDNGRMKVTCYAKHKFGHERPTTIDVPMGSGTPIMSAPQVEMATMTYAKRYAFCNAFGIVTGDEDNDAQDVVNGSNPQPQAETPKQSKKAEVVTSPIACSGDCGTIIDDEAVIAYSKARFGKPLCRNCQDQQQ